MTIQFCGYQLVVLPDGRLDVTDNATISLWMMEDWGGRTLHEFAEDFRKLKDADGHYLWSPDFGKPVGPPNIEVRG